MVLLKNLMSTYKRHSKFMKKRIEYIDLAKGICISLVVLWHVLRDQAENIDFIQIMFFFRMPLYFILSGMFFKTYNDFSSFTKKKTNRLLIPYFFSLIFIAVPSVFFLDHMNGNNTTFTSFTDDKGRIYMGIVPSAWFLVCLFQVNLYFYSIFILARQNIKSISIICILLGLLVFFINSSGLYLPVWFDTSLTVMPFFLLGYLLKNSSNTLYESITKKHILHFILSLSILLSSFYILEHQHLESLSFYHNDFKIKIISLYLGGVSGSYAILLISKYFQHIPIISYIGRYSIVVLITHQPLLFIIRNIIYQLRINFVTITDNLIVYALIILLSLPTIKICIKYLPYFFAQKDLIK